MTVSDRQEGLKRVTRRRLRVWVRQWWADRMRNGNLPDVPEEFDDSLIDEVWTAESQRLASLIDGLTL